MPFKEGRAEETENKDPLVVGLEQQLQGYEEQLTGQTLEATRRVYKALIEGVKNNDLLAREEAEKKLGWKDVVRGEQKLDSRGMKPQDISQEEWNRIDRSFNVND